MCPDLTKQLIKPCLTLAWLLKWMSTLNCRWHTTNTLNSLNGAGRIRFRAPLLEMPTKNTPMNSKVLFQISLHDNYLCLVGNNLALWVRSEAACKGDDTLTVWPGHGRHFRGPSELHFLICTAWGKDNECSDLPMTIKWKKQLLLCDGWGDTFRSKSEGVNKTFNKTKREAQMTKTKRLHLYSKARINISKWHVENTVL